MRYPGGNFVSGYYWEDGVGPKDKRPSRAELAWQVIESNQFGLNELTVFAVNKSLEEDLEVNCDFRQFADYKLTEHIILNCGDLKAVNTEEDPNRVLPVTGNASRMESGKAAILLEKHSWNVIRFKKEEE